MRRGLIAVGATVLVGAVAELVLLGVLISWIGVGWTLGLLIAKGIAGSLLVRRVGRRGWRQFRASLDAGRPPGRDVTDAAVALIGAMLVLLAGFLGATVGAALLAPPVRRAAAGLAERMVERRLSATVAGDFFGPRRVRVRREPVQVQREPIRVRPEPPGATPAAATPANAAAATAAVAAEPADVAQAPKPAAPEPGGGGPPPVIEGEVLPPADRR